MLYAKYKPYWTPPNKLKVKITIYTIYFDQYGETFLLLNIHYGLCILPAYESCTMSSDSCKA